MLVKTTPFNMGEHYVYLLVDPTTNMPFYVGKGKGRRCDYHLWEARFKTYKKSYKLHKIRKLLSKGIIPKVVKVEENVSDTLAKDFEMLIIAELRSLNIKLTNVTEGGDGGLGLKPSKETRLKTSLALKGRPSPMKGRLQTDEAKAKMSAQRKGIPKPKVECPHCQKSVAVNTAKRWHFDNCKEIEYV